MFHGNIRFRLMSTRLSYQYHEKDSANRKEIKNQRGRSKYFPFVIPVYSHDGSLFIKFVKPIVA